ncbi:aminotransferase-like domain-containing protein [Cytobacillus kochii]
MDEKINRELKKPIYKQIADEIENGISDGTFPADKNLPSERQLAKTFQVNRSTIVAAYDDLESKGLIERRIGSGTVISKDIWGMTKKRMPSWNRYIEAGSFLPNLPITQKIRKEMEKRKLINMASGELSEDLYPIDILREITQTQAFIGRLGYDHPQGSEALRNTITKHVEKYRNIQTTPASILVTSGAQQALHLVVQCLLKPGDAVVIEDPSYHYNLPIFKSAGIQVYTLSALSNRALSAELLSLHKKHRISMIFLNPAFQNPTGRLFRKEQLQEILDISSVYGIPVIEDDPYSLISFNNNPVSTLKSMDQNGNVLYISSLSKLVASGLRIGWIIGPNSVIERLSDAKQQIDFGHASYTQWIANDFLESKHFPVHLDRIKTELVQRRNEVVASLKKYLGDQVVFTIPQGGIHIWCEINRDVDEMKLLENAIKQGVIYFPGMMMGSKKLFVRFTFGRANEEQIRTGIQRFSAALALT